MAFQPMTPPNPTATLPWYERMNPFGDFVPAAEKSARAQGLLQLGLGILGNNQGNYGALGPALARGGMQGLQAYQGALMQQSQKRRNQLQDKLLGAQINETTAQAQERQAKMLAEQQAQKTLEEEMANWRKQYAPRPVAQPEAGGGGMQFIDIQSPDQLPANVETVPGEPNMFTARVGDNQYAAYRLSPNALPAGVDPMNDPGAVRELAGRLVGRRGLLKQGSEMFDLATRLEKAKTEGRGFMQRDDGSIVLTDTRAGTVSPVADGTKPPTSRPGLPYYTWDSKQMKWVIDEAARDEYLKDKKAGATNVTTKVEAFEPASVQAQKDFTSALSKRREALQNAPSTIKNLQGIRSAVSQLKTFKGSMADKKIAIANFLNSNFGTQIAPDDLANAQALNTRLFLPVMENLRAMDAQPSQAQQMMLQEAMGRITSDPGAIIQITKIMEDSIREKVKSYQRDVESASKNNIRFPFDPTIELPESKEAKQVKRTGMYQGRKVVEYMDGSMEFAE